MFSFDLAAVRFLRAAASNCCGIWSVTLSGKNKEEYRRWRVRVLWIKRQTSRGRARNVEKLMSADADISLEGCYLKRAGVESRFGFGGDFFERNAGCQLDQLGTAALAVDFKTPRSVINMIDHTLAGQRQRAVDA